MKEIAIGLSVYLNVLSLDEEGASIDDSLSNDELYLFGQGYLVWKDAIAHLVRGHRQPAGEGSRQRG
jgi:hypothetical protein